MNPIKATEITVGRNTEYSDYFLGCCLGSFRYHVWVTAADRRVRGQLFKNPPLSVDRCSPDYFHTRKLSIDVPTNAELIAHIFRYAVEHDLFAQADAKLIQEAEAHKAEIAKQIRLNTIRDAAPEMFEALEAIDTFWADGVCDAAIHPGAYLTAKDEPIRDVIRAAIRKARGTP